MSGVCMSVCLQHLWVHTRIVFSHWQCAYTYCLFSLAVSEDPPRPPDGSPLCLEMAGYSAARGEFTVEYNNFAEMDICNLTLDAEDKGEDEEDTELMNGELREYF